MKNYQNVLYSLTCYDKQLHLVCVGKGVKRHNSLWKFSLDSYLFYTKENLFHLCMSVCWFVRKIAQKLTTSFPPSLDGGWV